MSLKVKVGGAYVTPASIKVKVGGAYVAATSIKAKAGGAYQAVAAVVPAFIAGAAGTGSTSAIDTTGAKVIYAAMFAPATSVVTDNKGNTYTASASQANGGAAVRLYTCVNPITGPGHTFSVTGSNEAVAALAFTAGGATIVSQNGQLHSGLAGTMQPGAVTTDAANEIVLTALDPAAGQGPVSIDSGFTIGAHIDGITSVSYGVFFAYLIKPTAGSVSPTWSWPTNTNGQTCVIAALK